MTARSKTILNWTAGKIILGGLMAVAVFVVVSAFVVSQNYVRAATLNTGLQTGIQTRQPPWNPPGWTEISIAGGTHEGCPVPITGTYKLLDSSDYTDGSSRFTFIEDSYTTINNSNCWLSPPACAPGWTEFSLFGGGGVCKVRFCKKYKTINYTPGPDTYTVITELGGFQTSDPYVGGSCPNGWTEYGLMGSCGAVPVTRFCYETAQVDLGPVPPPDCSFSCSLDITPEPGETGQTLNFEADIDSGSPSNCSGTGTNRRYRIDWTNDGSYDTSWSSWTGSYTHSWTHAYEDQGSKTAKAQVKWQNNPSGVDQTRTCTDTVLIEDPEPESYTLTVEKVGLGSGTVTDGGIDCGLDCQQSYPEGTNVTLTADKNGGSTFDGWSGGGCSGTGQCTVTMDAAKTVTATFSISVPECDDGTITVTSNELTGWDILETAALPDEPGPTLGPVAYTLPTTGLTQYTLSPDPIIGYSSSVSGYANPGVLACSGGINWTITYTELPPAPYLEVRPSQPSVQEGNVYVRFNAFYIDPGAGTEILVTTAGTPGNVTTWFSENPTIAAAINSPDFRKGRVRGLSPGTATVRAEYDPDGPANPEPIVSGTAKLEVTAIPPPQCSDGEDNDTDTLTDIDDPGCYPPSNNPEIDSYEPSDDDERNRSSQCSDGFDNDGDGDIDHPNDAGCDDPEDDDESSPECSDNSDNDGDGNIDEDDPGCWTDQDDEESYDPTDDTEGDPIEFEEF